MMSKSGDMMTLEGQFLIAMPAMGDDRFAHSVVFICAHSDEGAMGLVVNKLAQDITFPDLLGQLEITSTDDNAIKLPVYAGGPVEPGRGFVLHSPDYHHDSTTVLHPAISLTATLDVLRAIANGEGPHNHLVALGYAGWGPGQLESEMATNGWLNCDADPEMMFKHDGDDAWRSALGTLGIDPTSLVSDAGHA